MSSFQVVITDHGFPGVDRERQTIEKAGGTLRVAQCKTAAEVIAAAAGANALLVQWAPITAEVVEHLPDCKCIVRYGIGVDNVDLIAAKEKGIVVCNIPDYAIDEVADHALALALACNRLLVPTDRRLREGTWKIIPPGKVVGLRGARFAVAGFGRIGRAVLDRAKAFGCVPCAYDPFVSDEALAGAGVQRLSLEELFATTDLVSLHLPLNAETRHLVSQERLQSMRPTAVLVNTSRGGLIDTVALAKELEAGTISAAGLDVYEIEPLAADHPLRQSRTAILTSHTAWYSEASIPRLQQLAGEEIARAIRGEKPLHSVNP
jgi:D-3-phosphoglycerate dehydrogenase